MVQQKPAQVMNQRDTILQNVRQNQPSALPLPEIAVRWDRKDNQLHRFVDSIEKAGGTAFVVAPGAVESELAKRFPDPSRVTFNARGSHLGNVQLYRDQNPRDLIALDVFVCEGLLGVAENGAVYVPESCMMHRVAPFIAQHLVLILERTNIVPTMHEAYARIDIEKTGYGVFIAGPSKTADIEQSLVIGAHGPCSLAVAVIGEPA